MLEIFATLLISYISTFFSAISTIVSTHRWEMETSWSTPEMRVSSVQKINATSSGW